MVLAVFRGDNGDGDHFRIRRLRPPVAPMAELFHGEVNRQQRCHHPFGVHHVLRDNGCAHAGTTDDVNEQL